MEMRVGIFFIISETVMKKLFFVVLLLFATFAITQTVFSLNNNNDSEEAMKVEREYIDLTKDAVVPGGLSGEKVKEMIANGYVLYKSTKDVYTTVGFKSSDGKLYSKQGWIKAGVEVLILFDAIKKPKHVLLRPCGNPGEDLNDYGYWD